MRLVEVDGDDVRLLESQKSYFQEISIRFRVKFDPGAGESEAASGFRYWHVIAVDGEAVTGCGSLRDLGEGRGEVKRVWVSLQARGKGVAGLLMDWLEARASLEGFSRILLDTNKTLSEARSMYLKRGYVEIPRYNDNPYADHFFEKKLQNDAI